MVKKTKTKLAPAPLENILEISEPLEVLRPPAPRSKFQAQAPADQDAPLRITNLRHLNRNLMTKTTLQVFGTRTENGYVSPEETQETVMTRGEMMQKQMENRNIEIQALKAQNNHD